MQVQRLNDKEKQRSELLLAHKFSKALANDGVWERPFPCHSQFVDDGSFFGLSKANLQRINEGRLQTGFVERSGVVNPSSKQIRIARLAVRGGYHIKQPQKIPYAAPSAARRGVGGLSNVSKLGKWRTKISVSPGNIKIKIQDEIAYTNDGLPHLQQNKGVRQPVREFTASSRMNMIRRANDIEGMGIKPSLMITLTYPGRWLDAVCDGKDAKRHLELFRDRLRKHLFAKYAVHLSYFWFLEFQRRGAPHFHLLIWTSSPVSYLDVRIRDYVSRSWQEVVNAPDENERALHLKAGTRVELCRSQHFGYAKMYASKPKQKDVPDGWLHVGRFWGFYNVPKYKPIQSVLFVPLISIFEGECCRLASSICLVAPEFARRFLMRVAKMLQHGNGYGSWTFHGKAIVSDFLLPKME